MPALAMIGDAGRWTGVAHMPSSLPGGMNQGVGVPAWGLPCQLPCLLFSLVFSAYRGLTLSWYLCVQAVVFTLSSRPDRPGHSGDIEYIFLDNLRTTSTFWMRKQLPLELTSNCLFACHCRLRSHCPGRPHLEHCRSLLSERSESDFCLGFSRLYDTRVSIAPVSRRAKRSAGAHPRG